MTNLVLTRPLSTIEQNLVEDVANPCLETGRIKLTEELIKDLKVQITSVAPGFWEEFDLPDGINNAIYVLLERAATAGYLWGLRAGYSSGYTDAIGALNNQDLSKHQAMAEFRATTHDANFIDQQATVGATVALAPLYTPTRIELNA